MFSSLDFQLNLNYLVCTSNSPIAATEPVLYPAGLARIPSPFAHQFNVKFQPIDIAVYLFKFFLCQPVSFQTLLFSFSELIGYSFFFFLHFPLCLLLQNLLPVTHQPQSLDQTLLSFALSRFVFSWSFCSHLSITNLHPPPNGPTLTPYHDKLKNQDIQK